MASANPEAQTSITFQFELDTFQKQAIDSINNGNNVLVTAHTGSGKTVIAEYAIDFNLRKYPDKKVLYISPIKSLSNEKYKDMSTKFTEYSIGILTGDNKINPDANVIIITAEILRNDFFLNKKLIGNISCCIFDEVHYINDRDRGTVWEEIFVMIDPQVQLVMLSATVAKPHEFSNWIASIKQKPTDLITTQHRIIPLTHYLYVFREYDNGKIIEIMDNVDNFNEQNYYNAYELYRSYSNISLGIKITKLVNFLVDNNLLQTIIFSFSRNKCEQYANLVQGSLIEINEAIEIENIIDKKMHGFKERYEKLHQYNNLLSLIRKGVAYHHSGLIPILKELVEIIFKQGLIKLLFATETFAVGVNMPTRTVVITDINKMSNTGRRLLSTAEYKQISGRAGRRGKDTIGNVILLPLYEFPQKDNLKKVLLGELPHISSKFNLDYLFVLKSIKTNNNIVDIFSRTLLSKQQNSDVINIKSKIKNLESELSIVKSNITDISLDNDFQNLIEMIEMRDNLKHMKFSFDKKQEKEYKRLNMIVTKSTETRQHYESYKQKRKLETELYSYTQKLNSIETYVINYTIPLISVLYNFNYINKNMALTDLCSDDITIRGNIGVFINECNFILLTELIVNGIFDDLVIQEIITLLAIFIETKEKEIGLDDLDITPNMNKKLRHVTSIVNDLKFKEINNNDKANEDFWTINYDFVNIAYMWACGCDIREIKGSNDIYEGNFIKNITKINNICNEIINTSEIVNNIELIIKLKAAEPLLIRDIVTVSSLYIDYLNRYIKCIIINYYYVLMILIKFQMDVLNNVFL